MRIGTDPDRIQLPPAEELGRLPEAIAKAGAEVESLRKKHEAERRNLVEAEHALDGAAEQDDQRAADALRQKKPAPTRSATTKAQKQVDDLKPKVRALEVAASDAERDLRAAVAKYAEEHQAKLGEEVDRQRAECLAIVEALVKKIGERQATNALKAWLAEPTRAFNPGQHGGHFTQLQRPNGEQLPVADVAAALTTAFAPPAPPAPKPKVQPLTKVLR